MTARADLQPPRTAMQSGKAQCPALGAGISSRPSAAAADPLMGWTSSGDMNQQISLSFDTKEEAVAYAERNGIAYRLFERRPERLRKKSYSDNFRWGRPDNWTHDCQRRPRSSAG